MNDDSKDVEIEQIEENPQPEEITESTQPPTQPPAQSQEDLISWLTLQFQQISDRLDRQEQKISSLKPSIEKTEIPQPPPENPQPQPPTPRHWKNPNRTRQLGRKQSA